MSAREEIERKSENERRIIVTEEWCQRILQEAGVDASEDRLQRILDEAFGYWGGGDPISVGIHLRLLQAAEMIEGADLTEQQRALLDRHRKTFDKFNPSQ